MQVTKQKFSFEKTGHFSSFFLSYISKNTDLTSFYNIYPQIENFKELIKKCEFSQKNRELMVKVLNQQYCKLQEENSLSTETSENIKKLKSANCYTVTTGHQLGIFTGPLYFIYKIATTISLAEKLKKEYPEKEFVPVFWMASEDHDIAEIDHAFIYGKKIKWKNAGEGAAGRLNTSSLKSVLEELKVLMGNSPHAEELYKIFNKCYLNNSTLSEATRCLVNELFGKYGLVIIDPDEKQLKKELIPVFIEDALKNTSFRRVNETIEEFNKIGIKDIQVNPREINLFYLSDNDRKRIEKREERFVVVDSEISFSEAELVNKIESYPERFSPNVVLRPIYQQVILPNLAYIGGPGEIAYWLEFRKMFDAYNVFYPVLVPRSFNLYIEAETKTRMDKMGVEVSDLFLPVAELTKNVLKRTSLFNLSIEEEQEQLKIVFERLLKKVSEVDPTLKGTVEAEAQKSLSSMKNIESKMIKAAKLKEETLVGQAEKLKLKLFQEGSLQERQDNFIPFYIKYGRVWIDEIVRQSEPFNFKFNILEETR